MFRFFRVAGVNCNSIVRFLEISCNTDEDDPDDFSQNNQPEPNEDYFMVMFELDLIVKPTGNDYLWGLFQPYLCAGPSAAQYFFESETIPDEGLAGWNIGGGLNFDLGEDMFDLNIDYRWYDLNSNEYHDQTRQAITIGLSWDF